MSLIGKLQNGAQSRIQIRIRIKEGILDALFPKRCPFCERILPLDTEGWSKQKENRHSDVRRERVCEACKKKLVYAVEPVCKKCGKPLHDERREYCEDCMRIHHVFAQGRSLLSYQGMVKTSLYRFKYSNKREYAGFYGEELWRVWGKWMLRRRIDLITGVPLYRRKEQKRGYNQAWILAKKLSELSGIPADRHLLVRVKNTSPQKQLSHAERQKNLKSAFCGDKSRVYGKRILLVDDIYTTGSTVDEASRALLQAGCMEVYVLTAAIGG